jgi:hypothetical protein
MVPGVNPEEKISENCNRFNFWWSQRTATHPPSNGVPIKKDSYMGGSKCLRQHEWRWQAASVCHWFLSHSRTVGRFKEKTSRRVGLVIRLESLPWKRPFKEVNEHVPDGLHIISARMLCDWRLESPVRPFWLTNSYMCVNRDIMSGASKILSPLCKLFDDGSGDHSTASPIPYQSGISAIVDISLNFVLRDQWPLLCTPLQSHTTSHQEVQLCQNISRIGTR